jgi:hypothetical protein
MKRVVFGGLALVALSWTLVVQAAPDPNDPKPPVVSLGDNTYALKRGSNFVYFRDTTKLARQARTDAEKFCQDMGKKMKELSMEEKKGSLVFGDFSKATITFKALAPDDPAFSEASSSGGPSAGNTGDLTKLEELHRSGVLADPEFNSAKKRLAEKSLEDLHQKGVLTDAEYEAARKRLSER